MVSLPILDATATECPPGCGRCCDRQGTPPMMMDEYNALPFELRWNRVEHGGRYDRGEACLWYDAPTQRCQHYEHRPRACREAVVPGDEHCNEFRAEPGAEKLSENSGD